MLKICMAIGLSCWAMVLGAAAELRPESVGACFPAPDRTADFTVRVAGLKDGTDCEYRVGDYAGNQVAQGRGRVEAGRLKIALKLAQGYYEISFPGLRKVFGLVVLPSLAAGSDGFWCLDAGLSWSKWKPETKREMVEVLIRRGISGFRERLSWPQLDAGDRMALEDGVPARVRDTVYGPARGRILELFQDSPLYLRRDRKNPFAIDLAKSIRSWSALGARFGRSWSALELWNEPFFVKGLPADLYVPVAKMTAAAVPDIPVAAGCFSPSIPLVYLDNCAENGLLDVINALTLHLYGKPEATPELITFYLDWLKRHGRAEMPIWVSESGTPGQLGKFDRPEPRDDGSSALSTVMRAVECKAYGVRRFYAFYLQRHIEGVISWGMTDAAATPQRGLAAWLYAARAVGNAEYLGDLNRRPAGVVSAHAFGHADEAVVVLYAPGRKPVKASLPCRAVTGIDGRALARNRDGSIPVPDGLTYLHFRRSELEPLLNRRSAAMKANAAAGKTFVTRQFRRIVVQPEYNRTQTAQASNLGYFLKPEEAGRFKVSAYVANLSEAGQKATVELTAPGLVIRPVEVELKPYASQRVEWTVDLRQALAAAKAVRLNLLARGRDAEDRAVMVLRRQPPGRIYQAVKCGAAPIIDGDSGDAAWSQGKPVGKLACADDAPDGKPADRTGLDAQARFLWDNTALYFLIEVDDRKHEPAALAALAWQKDSVQIAIHQENSPQDINTFEFGFFLDAAGKPQVTLFRSSNGKKLSGTTRVAVRRDEGTGKTVYEGMITWLDLGSMQAINDRLGMRFRMSFIVNDANGGRRRWLEWSPGIAKDKQTSDYPEIILSEEDGESRVGNIALDLGSGWNVNPPGRVVRTVYQGTPALKILDQPAVSLGRPVETLPGKPLTFSFRLAASEFSQHRRTGFCFKAKLLNTRTREGIEVWIAPGPMFAKTSYFVLADHDGTIIKLGPGEVKFAPDGKLHRFVLMFDPESRLAKFYLERNGERVLIAEGQSKRALGAIDRMEFSTSGWGSGPLILADLFLK